MVLALHIPSPHPDYVSTDSPTSYICELRGKVFLAHEPLDEVLWRLKSLPHGNLYLSYYFLLINKDIMKILVYKEAV